jgi:hypothetical protein
MSLETLIFKKKKKKKPKGQWTRQHGGVITMGREID